MMRFLPSAATACVLLICAVSSAGAAPRGGQDIGEQGVDGPGIFSRDPASAIGQARQYYDKQLYDSFEGNPGAQFQLRQRRQNLCRNVPQMC